jgi:uncharacterized phage protein (TIGR01671 family)
MSDVKFKIWNYDTNKFVNIQGVSEWLETEDIGFNGYTEPEKHGYTIDISTYENVEFLMFTGLHDKKGHEIYVGDIVALEGETTEGFFRTDHYEILINDFSKIPVIDSPRGQEHLYKVNQQCKVVGNIYQNGNLVEKEF